MKIEVDQSGKIENTSHNTVIAFSNGEFRSIIILGVEKRKVQKIFREIDKPRMFIYRLFAILIFILIRPYLNKLDEIVIDLEYSGKDYLIKNFLLSEIRKIKPKFYGENIIFKRIGKKSRAHFLAYGVATGKKTADKIISSKQILKFLVR